MSNRSVVVSEPCLPTPGFEPGVHYLAEETHHLMKLLEWVLNDKDGKEKARSVADAAYSAIHDPVEEAAKTQALIGILTA